jgi:methylenetetrahydrofolate dehydrogenase (NADP+) / methenyltetrahydrofolate cyclohydrolase
MAAWIEARFHTGEAYERTRVARVAATVMDGKALAERIRGEVAREIAALGHVGLATVLVGDDPASDVYIRSKHRAATEAGVDARDVRLPADTPEADVLSLIAELNADDEVDGILVQLPLPSHMDESRVTYAVAPHKDVDGFHPVNAGNLYLGTPLHVPATPAGCMELLAAYGIDPLGKDAVVIGRSEIVGRPAAMLLLQAHATVTICHSRTADLGAETRRAEIVVAAVGVPGILRADMVKPGAAVLDVGLTRTDEGIRGDVDPGVAEVAGFLTPMPGGTGPMTIALLLRSTVKAARYRRGLLAYPTL